MRILALDVGLRRTGVAFVDESNGIALPLDTIIADSKEDMIERVMLIIKERKVDLLVVGLPLLPSGDEGSQSEYVREVASEFMEAGVEVRFLDERYTTSDSSDYDGDAKAACGLLMTYLERH